MKKLIALAVLPTMLAHAGSAPGTIHGMRLLEGYRISKGDEVDVQSWTIEKPGGLRINCDEGPNPTIVSSKLQKDYAWYREQTINGHRVLIALIKPGHRTEYDFQREYQRKGVGYGNILLVSFPMSTKDLVWSANCSAKIAGPEEIVDTLLMTLTFDTSNASSTKPK